MRSDQGIKQLWPVILVKNQRDEAIRASFLELVRGCSLSALQKYDYLKQRSEDPKHLGWTLGMLIACYGDAVTVILYLNLLNELVRARVDLQLILDLVNIQSCDGYWTFPRLLLSHGDQIIDPYFSLLLEFLRVGGSAQALVNLLAFEIKDSKDNWRFDLMLVKHLHAETVEKYIALLVVLVNNGANVTPLSSVMLPVLLGQQNMSAICQLFHENLLSSEICEPYQSKLAQEKESLLSCIIQLSNLKHQKVLLKRAMNASDVLGKIFWVQRGHSVPSLGRGVLNQVRGTLQLLETIDRSIEMSSLKY